MSRNICIGGTIGPEPAVFDISKMVDEGSGPQTWWGDRVKRKYPKEWRIPWWIVVFTPDNAKEMRGIRKRILGR